MVKDQRSLRIIFCNECWCCFCDMFKMRTFGRLSNDLKSLFLVRLCWYHNVTSTFLYRKCQASEIFLVSIPNGCWYFYFRNLYYLFTLFPLDLAKKWKISFSPTFFPASRGLSRRWKNERKERDLSRLPTRFLSRIPLRFLNNQWRFCHVRHNPKNRFARETSRDI